MLHSDFQARSRPGQQPDDPLEGLINQAAGQYRALRYAGPDTININSVVPDSSSIRWRHMAAAAVLALAAAGSAMMWLPGGQRGQDTQVTRQWPPQLRQPSPHAALAAARLTLPEMAVYTQPRRPATSLFRLPEPPSRKSGFAADNQRSS